MEKQKETAFFGYLILLLILVISNMNGVNDLISIVYLGVVFCSFLKLILIVCNDKK